MLASARLPFRSCCKANFIIDCLPNKCIIPLLNHCCTNLCSSNELTDAPWILNNRMWTRISLDNPFWEKWHARGRLFSFSTPLQLGMYIFWGFFNHPTSRLTFYIKSLRSKVVVLFIVVRSGFSDSRFSLFSLTSHFFFTHASWKSTDYE